MWLNFKLLPISRIWLAVTTTRGNIKKVRLLLTLWCCLTMETRFAWKMCLLSSSLEADRTGEVSFRSENRSQ